MAELTLEELQQQFNDLKKRVSILEGNSKRKIDIEPKAGNQCVLAGLKWKIIDVLDLGCMCLAERSESMEFDPDVNDWRISRLRRHLNSDLLEKIENEIGEENVIRFERDLLSVDGQNQYRACKDKVSLLTLDEYRKYRSLIPNEEYYWWLLLHGVRRATNIINGLPLFFRPAASTAAFATTAAVFAQFVSFLLQSLNLRRSN